MKEMSQPDLQMQLFPFQESAVSIEVHVYEEIHTVGFIKKRNNLEKRYTSTK